MTVAESAEYAGVSRDTIYTACERGELHHARIGGRRSIRVKAQWIDAWLERHARGCEQLAKMNLHMHDLRREAGSRLLERGADLHTVQLFLDHANISTSSRYLKPSKLALHTTIKRIDAQRRESGEAAKWEQDPIELRKNLQQRTQKGPHADKIARQREAGKTITPPTVNGLGA